MTTLTLCIKIFLVRIIDVSLGTIRTVTVIKGKNHLASLIGFLEIFIWFVIAREALNSAGDNILIAISYAGGFAAGTYLGGLVSNYFLKGNVEVQVITTNKDLVNIIRKHGYAVSLLNIEGIEKEKEKYMLIMEINKDKLNNLKTIINKEDKKAFTVVSEISFFQNGYVK